MTNKDISKEIACALSWLNSGYRDFSEDMANIPIGTQNQDAAYEDLYHGMQNLRFAIKKFESARKRLR